MAQSLAAACRTVDADQPPTNLHLQFLRGGEAGEPVDYTVERVYDGRTAASRRVMSRQDGRLLTTATVSFAAAAARPRARPPIVDAGAIPTPCRRPARRARRRRCRWTRSTSAIDDDCSGGEFVRRLWWRTPVPLPDDPLLHTLVAVYVTDIYGIDPVLQVHGHSMNARSHRSGTTDSSIWFHRPIRADQWNLLESRSPAAARRPRAWSPRSLVGADGVIAATLVQEGSSPSGSRSRSSREPAPTRRIRLRASVSSRVSAHPDQRGTRPRPARRCSPNSGYTW